MVVSDAGFNRTRHADWPRPWRLLRRTPGRVRRTSLYPLCRFIRGLRRGKIGNTIGCVALLAGHGTFRCGGWTDRGENVASANEFVSDGPHRRDNPSANAHEIRAVLFSDFPPRPE